MTAPIPWSDDGSAFEWLRAVAGIAAGIAIDRRGAVTSPLANATRAAAWMRERDLVAPAYAWARCFDPDLAAHLRADALGSAAANLVHLETVATVESRLAASRIGMVLLKGAATATWAYPDPSLRPMTDVDVWVAPDTMDAATACLEDLGFRRDGGRADRPDGLQRESGGERILVAGEGRTARVELHYSPFQGWWTRRTASPDPEAVWARAVPMSPGRHARRLAAEDAVIQAAVHAVVSQFSQAPLRGILDIAVMARRQAMDWDAVAARAAAWRLSAAVWLVLDAADRLFGVPGVAPAVERLSPGAARRAVLRRFIGPATLLRGVDRTPPHLRHPFLLTMADRSRDAARLVGRTLWPEPWWLQARYGNRRSRLRHLRAMIRHGGA